MTRTELTVEYLYECFVPDFDKGILIWRERPRHHFKTQGAQNTFNTRFSGKVAGRPHNSGYMQVSVGCVIYLTHRLLYSMYRGSMLEKDEFVDHVDTDKLNSSISNLRIVTRSQNGMNRGNQVNNTSGFAGISWSKERGKWEVHIKIDGRKINLGRFDNIEKARLTRVNAEIEYFGEYRYSQGES